MLSSTAFIGRSVGRLRCFVSSFIGRPIGVFATLGVAAGRALRDWAKSLPEVPR